MLTFARAHLGTSKAGPPPAPCLKTKTSLCPFGFVHWVSVLSSEVVVVFVNSLKNLNILIHVVFVLCVSKSRPGRPALPEDD
jgi:hypothetical protein